MQLLRLSAEYAAIFSCDEATLHEGLSAGRMVGLSVTSYFFGLLGATYAVYTEGGGKK